MPCCCRRFTRFSGGWPSSAHGTSPCGRGFGSWTPSSRLLARCCRRWVSSVSCGLLHNDEHLLKQEVWHNGGTGRNVCMRACQCQTVWMSHSVQVPSLRNCAGRLPCHGHSWAASISLHPREWPLVQSSSSLGVHLHKAVWTRGALTQWQSCCHVTKRSQV
ncbi:uncharacterized protein LOC124676430 isoform X2 [Lolium rigidum]|uniref:uncharacterized protein LOC124676430 isoform X2 n=1 Tax=Lolium rigidum TaxID=89674 RepID=UPI001F5C2B71|nr:uncharacterized protein LOC124676430 isoform X2 [Lolium rigidum]